MPERLKSPLMALVLFVANVYVVRGLFSVEYLRHMGSIEGAYIGISRYVMAHFGDLTWFPLWYNGVPYQNTYPPFLHWCVALVAWVGGITPAHSHHWTTAVMYCLGPVTVFALVRSLSGSRWAGFAAGWIYTALSPSAWLIADVARDLGSVFRPRRLQALVFYGEGPHITAMTLLPLALLMVHLALEKRRPHYYLAAAVCLAGVVLSNWLGAFALALGVVAYLLAIVSKDRWRDFVLLAFIGAAAYCLAMPWVPPSTIATTQYNAKIFAGDFRTVYQALPKWLAVIGCGLGLLKLAGRKLPVGLQFAIYFTFPISLITLTDAWFKVPIVPQPLRYHLEMEMALAILVVLVGREVLRFAPRAVSIGVIVALCVLLVPPLRIGRRYARTVLITTIDVTKTSEWRVADWLNKNWSGERVMVPGSIGFWLAAFSDVPQLEGGFDQGIIDHELPIAAYGMTAVSGPEWGEYSVLWLKALGAQAVAMSGPGSTEVYKPFVDPKKFEGLLEPLWRDGGDVIYRVGAPHRSLVRVVPRANLVSRAPYNGADIEPLRPYVAALEDAAMPEARFTWTSQHSGRVAADLSVGQVLSWQVAFHKGWRARAGDREIPIVEDALGMMTVDPGPGHRTIDLVYDGGLEMRVAKWMCGMAAIFLVGWCSRDLIATWAARRN